jgi:hypothetical protein
MLFVPIDLVRKFGCNGPVGVFIDESGGLCVRKSLSDDDCAEFTAYERSQEDAKARTAWYSTLPDLTDEQIEATWHPDEDEKYPGVEAAYCQTMARMRALK